MRPITWLTIGGGGLLVLIVGVWVWLVRDPTDGGQSVSSSWLDDHIRGRRD